MMLFEHNPEALAFLIYTCLSIVFATLFLSTLVLKATSDSHQSARELNDLFRFMQDSKPLLDEYYARQRRGQLQANSTVADAVDGAVVAHD